MLDELIGWQRSVGAAWSDALGVPRHTAPPLAQTPRDEIALDGGAKLYRFRSPQGARFTDIGSSAVTPRGKPFLLVPSLINRWYVLDLGPGRSLIEWLVAQGHEVFCIDWGTPGAEDRYLTWDDIAGRYIGRALRIASRKISGDHLRPFTASNFMPAPIPACAAGEPGITSRISSPLSLPGLCTIIPSENCTSVICKPDSKAPCRSFIFSL